MDITPLKLPGTFEVTLTAHKDDRGYFVETYRETVFTDAGLITGWVQTNQSFSKDKDTIRGLHFQLPPHAQAKLVQAVAGVVWDVFVDLRKDSATYGQWDAVELDASRFNLVFIPKGFGHGFCTLTPNALVSYRIDAYYAREYDTGLRWNDPDIGIEWPCAHPILSEKDRGLPLLADFDSPF